MTYSVTGKNTSTIPVSAEAIKQDLDQLTAAQLQQIADFIAFLRFKDKRSRVTIEPGQLASLATDFAEEDRALAEAGMTDYAARLQQEDQL